MEDMKNNETQNIVTSYTRADKKVRLNWLDALKGLAILTVVLGHVLLGYVDNQAFPAHQVGLSIFKEWIYTWHMPFFFVLSGFSFAMAYGKDGTVKWKKIIKQGMKLILIYLVFSLLYSGLKMIFASFVDHAMDISTLFLELLLPNTLMWYLWVLVAFYFLFGTIYQLLYKSKTNSQVLS